MRPVAVAVIRAGLVSQETLAEIRRWGLPIELVEENEVLKDVNKVVGAIQDALDSHEQVGLRDTDLDILQRFLDVDNQHEGKLVLVDEDRKSTVKVIYCLTTLGEYVIPWRGDSIQELMLSPDTHMKVATKEGPKKVFFRDIRELYVGDRKAFMVCVPGEIG